LSELGDVEDMAKNAIDLLKNEDKLNVFRKNALEQAKEFHIDKILPAYESYYREVIEVSVFEKQT